MERKQNIKVSDGLCLKQSEKIMNIHNKSLNEGLNVTQSAKDVNKTFGLNLKQENQNVNITHTEKKNNG